MSETEETPQHEVYCIDLADGPAHIDAFKQLKGNLWEFGEAYCRRNMIVYKAGIPQETMEKIVELAIRGHKELSKYLEMDITNTGRINGQVPEGSELIKILKEAAHKVIEKGLGETGDVRFVPYSTRNSR